MGAIRFSDEWYSCALRGQSKSYVGKLDGPRPTINGRMACCTHNEVQR